MGQPIILIDRTRVVTREECPRMRYLQFDLAGTGIDSVRPHLPLLNGIAIHAAHARLLAGEPLEQVVSDIVTKYKVEVARRGLSQLAVTKDLIEEQAALLEGMLRLWARIRMPVLLAEYEVVSIEQSWRWVLTPGVEQSLRMDAILRRREDGLLHILDYKTLTYPSEMWEDKFLHDHQTCLYIQALREKTGEPVGGILFEGLVKGQFRVDTAKSSPWFRQKIQLSPYTVAYKGELDGEIVYQPEYTNRKGFHRVRPYREMSMQHWVNNYLLDRPNVYEDLFVALPVICPPNYELEEVKEQTIREELEYHDKLTRYRAMPEGPEKEAFLNVFAPKRRQRCYKYGQDNRCMFAQDVCFNYGADPLSMEDYKPREPHHESDVPIVA